MAASTTAPAGVDDESLFARALPRLLVVVVGIVALAGLSFTFALEDQFGRLGTPATLGDGARDHVGFGGLHDEPEVALRTWEGGVATLHELHPVTPPVLVRVHAVVALVVTVAMAGALVLVGLALSDREGRRRINLTVRGALVVAGVSAVGAQLLASLCEAALVANPGGDVDRFVGLFSVADAVRLGGLGAAIALVVGIAVRSGAVKDALWSLATAPASHKATLLASAVFAAPMVDGDLGAQSEDLLRRELSRDWYAWLASGGALVLAVLLIDQVRRSDGDPPVADPETVPWTHLALGGSALAAAGSLVYAFGGGVSLRVIGLLVLVLALATHRAAGRPDAEAARRLDRAALSGLEPQERRRPAPPTTRSAILAAAIAVPPGGIAILTGRLLAGEVAIQRSWVPLLVLEGVLLAIAAAGVVIVSSGTPLLRGAGPVVAKVLLAAVVGLGLASWSSPGIGTGFGRTMGTLAILLVALALVPALGVVLRPHARSRRPLAFVIAPRRTPVLAVVVVWFLLAATIGDAPWRDSSPHLVRTVERRADRHHGECADADLRAALEPAVPDGVEADGVAALRDRLCAWVVSRTAARDDAVGDDAPLPLILATASGGGVRAATWTELVLDCALLEGGAREGHRCGEAAPTTAADDAWPLLFSAGGASGGSVGLASATAQRLGGLRNGNEAPVDDWVRALATRDHVGPVATRLALVEGISGWSGIQPEDDRAEVLIDSWAERFGAIAPGLCPEDDLAGEDDDLTGEEVDEVGFVTLTFACPEQVPDLHLNGAVVATGQRFDSSALGRLVARGQADVPGGEPARDTDDVVTLRDVVCDGEGGGTATDVPFFDVAFASARFPFVTPSVHFPGPRGPDCPGETARSADVVDGGYRENSGAAPMLDVLRVLRGSLDAYAADRPAGYPPIHLVLVEIENGEGKGGEPPTTDPDAGSGGAGPRGLVETRRSYLAEPARVLGTKAQVVRRGDPDANARLVLREAVREAGGDVVRFALARHPGRALPLGWSLTGAIVDDMASIMRLCPNQRALARLASLIDGSSPPAPPPVCAAEGDRPAAGDWEGTVTSEVGGS